MKKIFLLLMCIILTSCSHNKVFNKSDGTTFVAEPYGLLNYHSKIDGVIYEVNFLDIVLVILGSETVIIPFYILGWDIMEPIIYKE